MSETPVNKKRRTQVHWNDDDDSVQVLEPEPSDRRVTPTAAARSVVVDAVASHPEPIRELLLAMATKFNHLRSKLRQQEQTIQQLSEDSYIPRSARTNFVLTASDSVMENDKYKTLAKEMETVCDNFRKAAKKAISEVAKLEIEHTKNQIAQVFTTTAKHTAHLIILKHNAVLQFTDVELATLAIEKHGSSITKYSCMKLLDALNAISHPAAYSGSSFSDEKKEALAPLITTFALLMSAAFVDSWDKQLECYATQATERAMAKHVKDVLDGTATQAAAAAMDAEPTADPALLKDIVKKQVDCHHKQLQQQFNQLKQMVARKLPANGNTNKPAKNTTRGATTNTPKSANRAPSTNKKQPATPLKSALRKPSPKTPASPKNATKKPAASDGKQGNASPSGRAKIKLFKKASPTRGRGLPKNAKKSKKSTK